MTDDPDRTQNDEDIAVQLDKYVIAQLPKIEPEEAPRSWGEVARRVNGHLMSLAEGVFRLPAEAIDATARVFKSIGALFEKRVDLSHEKADSKENRLQAKAARKRLPDHKHIIESRKKFEARLNGFLANGVPVAIEKLEDGGVAVYLLPQEALGAARAVIKGELPAPNAAT